MSALLREAAGLARQASYWPEPAGPARQAGYFHLLAQMKVAKAKGPIRFGSLSWRQPTNNAGSIRSTDFRGCITSAASEHLESHRSRSWVAAMQSGQIGVQALFFGYFLLGQQKKVTAGGARPAGSHASQQGGQP